MLLAATVLRLVGIGFGLPLQLRPDEEIYAREIARMAATGDLAPRQFAYPGLSFHTLYLTLRGLHAAGDPFGLAPAEDDFAAFAARPLVAIRVQRALAALAGTLTVLAAFWIGCELGGRPAGLLAAAFTAVAPLLVRDSHFGVVDAPAACVATLAVAATLWGLRVRSIPSFLAAGALVGLAAGLRYLPAILLLPLLMAAWGAGRARGPGRIARLIWESRGRCEARGSPAWVSPRDWRPGSPSSWPHPGPCSPGRISARDSADSSACLPPASRDHPSR